MSRGHTPRIRLSLIAAMKRTQRPEVTGTEELRTGTQGSLYRMIPRRQAAGIPTRVY